MISRNRRRNGKAHPRRKDGEEGAGLSPSTAIEFATVELLSLRHCILPAPVLARFHYQLSHRGPNRARLAVSHSDERFALLGKGHGGGRRATQLFSPCRQETETAWVLCAKSILHARRLSFATHWAKTPRLRRGLGVCKTRFAVAVGRKCNLPL